MNDYTRREVVKRVEEHLVGKMDDGTYERPDKTFTAHEIREKLWELYDQEASDE